MRLECWWRDRLPNPASFTIPPALLRFKVSEDASAARFLDIGRRTAENLKAAGLAPQPGESVLDFGCGCGRTLLWLVREYPSAHWHGCDVDAEAIAWCSAHLPAAKFTANGPLPPLPYGDAAFDAIYGVSVFTHLDEAHQRAWLAELHRVLKPGGRLLLSFYSQHVWTPLDASGEVARGEFVFRTSKKWKGILPDWYQTALQSPQRIVAMFEEAGFTEVEYQERRLGDQDLVVARACR